ncbi:MAG: hypothetical protein AAB373_06105 [Patescibacteria group bacterium]
MGDTLSSGPEPIPEPEKLYTPLKPQINPAEDTPEARKAEADAMAENITKEKELTEAQKKLAEAEDPILKDLPEGEGKEMYKRLKEDIKNNPDMEGAATNMLLSLYALMAKYNKYIDLWPGKFLDSAKSDSAKPSPDEKTKLLEQKSNPDAEKIAKDLLNLKDEKDLASKEEQASTRYICESMWGISTIEDAKTLGAKLLNAKTSLLTPNFETYELIETSSSNYKGFSSEVIMANKLVPGTILVFVSDLKTATKLVARATEIENEIEYFDPKTKEVKKAKLNSADSPIKGGFGLLAGFVPNTADLKEHDANLNQFFNFPVNDDDFDNMYNSAQNRINLAKSVVALTELLKNNLLDEETKNNIRGKRNESLRILEEFLVYYKEMRDKNNRNVNSLREKYALGEENKEFSEGDKDFGEDIASKLQEEENKFGGFEDNIAAMEEQIQKLEKLKSL